MQRKSILALVALLVAAAVTGVSFAETTATTNASVATSLSGIAEVSVAGTSGKYGQTPLWNVTSGATGGIGAGERGDLFVVSSTGYSGDLHLTVYLNNPHELVRAYSYLNLALAVYREVDGAWQEVPVAGMQAGHYTRYLTLTNGYVDFTLDGLGDGEKYVVSVDSGSFYCIDATQAAATPPSFYIEAGQR